MLGSLAGALCSPAGAADETAPEPSNPIVERSDFGNGTVLTVIDFKNGTKEMISETIQTKTAKMLLNATNVINQTMVVDLPTSLDEHTEWITADKDATLEQEVLLGFTYQFMAERWTFIDVNVLVAYLRAGFEVDIGFGLRLPVMIALEYPEQMTVGRDYEFYATLTPLDRPDYDEFLCKFKAFFWVEAGVWHPEWYDPFDWEEYSASWGPNYDWSRSFPTPIGPTMEFPIPEFEFTVYDTAWDIGFSLLKLNVVVDPQISSNMITANATAEGDASGEHTLTWSEPNQRLPFMIHTDDLGPTDFARVELSDFRYYFSLFLLHFELKFDFHEWIDWLTGDPVIGLFTLDMSWLTEGLYLQTHQGTDGTVDVTIYVEKRRPPSASFTEDAHTVLVGTPIFFNPSSSYDFDGAIVSYEWDFDGDGVYDQSTTSPTVVSYAYAVPGTCTVTLRVTDNDGLTDTASATKTILPRQVIPEIPVGTIMASASMIIALVAYVTMPKWRKKREYFNP